MGFGRNDPCPCGSGKKYKKCCASKSTADQSAALPKGRFDYSSGTYGGPGKGYFPSILCRKQVGEDQWQDHFCLVDASVNCEDEDVASKLAHEHLKDALSNSSNPIEFAQSLAGFGYVKLSDFNWAQD